MPKLTFELGVSLRTIVQLFFFSFSAKTTVSCKLSLSKVFTKNPRQDIQKFQGKSVSFVF